MESELAANAAVASEYPTDGLPEVAVVGRSNVGKSTLINALTGRRKLARVAAAPGKTRRVHFYRLGRAMYLVDLPGYGYAAVSRSERSSWKPMVESYLRGTRQPLRGVLLLIDVRRQLEREETALIEWLADENVAVRLVLTKGDKVSAAVSAERRRALARAPETAGLEVTSVSARNATGLSTLGGWIEEWAGLVLRRPDGTPL